MGSTTTGLLPVEDRPKVYPAVGDNLRHAHEWCSPLRTVVAIGPHSDPRKVNQRAITIHDSCGSKQVFEMSVANFWFNWRPSS